MIYRPFFVLMMIKISSRVLIKRFHIGFLGVSFATVAPQNAPGITLFITTIKVGLASMKKVREEGFWQ